MFIAQTKDKVRISAENAYKDIDYYCPVCGEKVRLRRGSINAPHFAHIPGHDCTDTWHYDMSEWHLEMQNKFDEKYREVVVTHNGITHRADILKDGVVIEFQHSPISEDEIRERNEFYCAAGYKVAWVFDVRDKKENIVPINDDSDDYLRWKWPFRYMRAFIGCDEKCISVCLHFDDRQRYAEVCPDEFYDDIKRINWATANFNEIEVDSSYYIEVNNEMEMEEFFITPVQRLQQVLLRNEPYSIKYEGNSGSSGICPKTKKVIMKYQCVRCGYCIAIEFHRGTSKDEGFYYYCKYNKLHQRDEDYGIRAFNT